LAVAVVDMMVLQAPMEAQVEEGVLQIQLGGLLFQLETFHQVFLVKMGAVEQAWEHAVVKNVTVVLEVVGLQQ